MDQATIDQQVKIRHITYCSLKRPAFASNIKEYVFDIQTDLYRSPMFVNLRGICIERLVSIMHNGLTSTDQTDYYTGCAVQGFLKLVVSALLSYSLRSKNAIGTLVDFVIEQVTLKRLTSGPFLPEGLLSMHFISNVMGGSVTISVIYDRDRFDFFEFTEPDTQQCMSPSSFLV